MLKSGAEHLQSPSDGRRADIGRERVDFHAALMAPWLICRFPVQGGLEGEH